MGGPVPRLNIIVCFADGHSSNATNDGRISRVTEWLYLKNIAIKLSGEIVLVTGGNSVGSATQKRLSPKKGAFITSRGQPVFDVAVKEIGSKTTAASADVSKN